MASNWSYTLTLTTSLQVYNLATLMVAADSSAPPNVAELTISADVSNSNNVYVGGDSNSALSPTNYGVLLVGGSAFTWGAGNMSDNIATIAFNLVGDAASQKVHISARLI